MAVKEEKLEFEAEVLEALRSRMFRVRLDNGHEALGYMAGEHASIDHVTLLRDFIAWEPRPLLRSRARQ